MGPPTKTVRVRHTVWPDDDAGVCKRGLVLAPIPRWRIAAEQERAACQTWSCSRREEGARLRGAANFLQPRGLLVSCHGSATDGRAHTRSLGKIARSSVRTACEGEQYAVILVRKKGLSQLDTNMWYYWYEIRRRRRSWTGLLVCHGAHPRLTSAQSGTSKSDQAHFSPVVYDRGEYCGTTAGHSNCGNRASHLAAKLSGSALQTARTV